jgi:hypothetical protein
MPGEAMRLKGCGRILRVITDEGRPECAYPWHVTYRGAPWTVASDGFRLLALEGHLAEGRAPSCDVSKLTNLLALVAEPHEPLELPGEQFLAFCRVYSGLKGVCGNCGARCEACSPGEELHKATYGDIPFHLDWIAEVLGSLQLASVMISLEGKILRLAGNGWLYAQMGMMLGSVEGLPKIEDAVEAVTNG